MRKQEAKIEISASCFLKTGVTEKMAENRLLLAAICPMNLKSIQRGRFSSPAFEGGRNPAKIFLGYF